MSFSCIGHVHDPHNDLDSHTSRYFTELVTKSGHDPKSVRGVSVEELTVVEEIVQKNIFIYDFDIKEGEYVGNYVLEGLIKLSNY